MTEPLGLVAGLDDVAVVGQEVQQRRGHLCIAEHRGPLREGQVGADAEINVKFRGSSAS